MENQLPTTTKSPATKIIDTVKIIGSILLLILFLYFLTSALISRYMYPEMDVEYKRNEYIRWIQNNKQDAPRYRVKGSSRFLKTDKQAVYADNLQARINNLKDELEESQLDKPKADAYQKDIIKLEKELVLVLDGQPLK